MKKGNQIVELSPTHSQGSVSVTAPNFTQTSPISPAATKFILMPDAPSLQLMILELMNQDRRAAGLEPLEWDQTAALTGVSHAQEMAQYGYINYWNLDGFGPDLRFYSNGGIESITERSYRKQITSEILPATPSDWDVLTRNIYAEFSQSPSFRDAVLNPGFTHLS